jgi:hypothetical protein
MLLVHIWAGSEEAVSCLVRELSVYLPKRLRSVVAIELERTSPTDLLALLTAIEMCLTANDIGAVRIAIDGKRYMMASSVTR